MSNPHLKETLIEVIENQLRLGDPPATRETLERLLAAGHSRPHALALISAALLTELNEMLRDQKNYDAARYARRLARLR